MARVNDDEVRGIIDDDVEIPMQPFITTATVMTDYVDSCDTDNVLSANHLKEIERWLAAHYYAHRDQQYISRINVKFQGGEPGVGTFDTTHWGRTAMGLDISGCLTRLNKEAETGRKISAGITWLGKAPSDQIDYVDRD